MIPPAARITSIAGWSVAGLMLAGWGRAPGPPGRHAEAARVADPRRGARPHLSRTSAAGARCHVDRRWACGSASHPAARAVQEPVRLRPLSRFHVVPLVTMGLLAAGIRSPGVRRPHALGAVVHPLQRLAGASVPQDLREAAGPPASAAGADWRTLYLPAIFRTSSPG
jgi:hypothetical protein